MQRGKLALRFCLKAGLWLLLMGALLLGGAQNAYWPQAWCFLALFAAGNLAFGIWLIRRDPDLLASRLGSFSQKGQPLWDKLFLLMFIGLWLGWLWLMGRDVGVWHISHMPLVLNAAGGLMLVSGFFAVVPVFRANSFAAPVVRVQGERFQRVIDTGPYARVRHPMYAAALLYMFGAPLLLGSWLGVAGALILAVGLMRRAVLEENMLRRELAGYDAYMSRVRFRLIPGIW